MATLLSTTVPDNGYYRVGTSTNTAYVSSGGVYAHLGQNAWYTSALGWQGGGGTCTVGGSTIPCGPFLQLYNNSLYFYTSANFFINPFFVSAGTTTLGSTTTTLVAVAGNSDVNSTLGVGATAVATKGSGKILVNAGGTGKPFLEATNCLGNGSTSTSTYSVFKGYLGIKISANVGATAVTTGTYYIRLWFNA
jgi:hypothetical protein